MNQLDKIGVQLYTLRDKMAKDPAATLRHVSQLGFREVEFAGAFGRDPAKLKSRLQALDLRPVSCHITLPELKYKLDRAILNAVALGVRYLGLGWISPEMRRSLTDYHTLASLLNRAGKTCRAKGLVLAYHNHDFEFRPITGKIPFQLLLEKTHPDRVGFELDLYWITKAGANPLDYFKQYPGRFLLCHLKDMAPGEKQAMTEVGKGIIDFQAVLAKSGEAGFKHYFVEHDNPADPYLSIRESYQYLKKLKY